MSHEDERNSLVKIADNASRGFIKNYSCMDVASNNSPPHDSNYYDSLPYLASVLFATVLEDSIQCFCILGECNNHLRALKMKFNLNSSQAKKYGIELPKGKPYGQEIVFPLDCFENKLKKMTADKTFFGEVLRNVYRDLCLNARFTPLIEALDRIEDNSKYVIKIEEEVDKNKAQVQKLKRQLRSLRAIRFTALYDFESKISNLRATKEDTKQMSNIRINYAEKWQNSRKEQHGKHQLDVRSKSSKSIHLYKDKLFQENRVHNDLAHYTQAVIEEKRKKIKEIMEKYDEDMEAIELQIHINRSEWMEIVDVRKGLEAKIRDRERLMQEWIKFKEDREREIRYNEMMTRSALIVQAWWRGILVREQLGPFRPKRRKPRRPIRKNE